MKQQGKFTPGPWSRIRAYEDKPQLFDVVGGHPATTIVAKDVHSLNVTLIAAAPEMYELLERIGGLLELGLSLDDWRAIKDEGRRIKAEIDGEVTP